MTRTSHALATGEGVWLVDPVDWPDAIDRASSLGTPAGVIQLLDRHNRDAAAIAERLGVPHLRVPASLPGTPFEVIEIKRCEALAGDRALVAGAARARGRGCARHEPVLHDRRRPRRRSPVPEADAAAPAARATSREHLLVGHGEGVHGPEATIALRQALSRSRLSAVRWAASLPFRMRRAAVRDRADAAPIGTDRYALAPASPGRTSRAGRFSPASRTGGLSGSSERLGAERAQHLLLGRRAVGRRALARHSAGRADHGLHLLRRKLLPPLRARPPARSTRSSASHRDR